MSAENLAAIFAPCDLWVFPTPRFSHWFTRLDWYTNWQLSKGLAYGGLHLPPETHRLADEYGVPVLARSEETLPPLLVIPGGQLPAKSCLVIDEAPSFKDWMQKASRCATQLGAHEVRLFLPRAKTEGEARQAWKASDKMQAHFTVDWVEEHSK